MICTVHLPTCIIIAYVCAHAGLTRLVTIYEGQSTGFLCASVEVEPHISSVQWIVNGSALEDLAIDSISTTRTTNTSEALSILKAPLHYSGTTFQCVVTFRDNNNVSSNIANLQVQGDDHMHYIIIILHVIYSKHDHYLQVYWMLFLM